MCIATDRDNQIKAIKEVIKKLEVERDKIDAKIDKLLKMKR